LGLFEVIDEDTGPVLAMIHGTRTSASYASDASMSIGSHEPNGPTVGLHTLCVHPGWRTKGLGTRILKEYLKRMENEKGVERVALIAHDELVPFYERYYW
jgi:GNAT superfamily N-acetyltransferase